MVKYFFIDKSYPYNINIFDQRIAEYYVWGSNLLNKSDAKQRTTPINGSLSLPTNTTFSGGLNESDSLPTVTQNSTLTTKSTFYSLSSPRVQSSSAATTAKRIFFENDHNSTKPLCPVIPPVLVGPIKVWFDYPSWDELMELYPFIKPGGHGQPENCTSRHKVAIILPYRDRDRQLRAFLHNLHSLLTKQQLDYSIFVVEQIPHQTFNRAKLLNVGFAEAKKLYDWQCFIFHDVDLFPEDDRNLYTCPEQPRHMSVAVDKFSYKLPYATIFGGITALTVEQFEKLNGFSNDYWGWGGEDDDMASRVKLHGFEISRYDANIARYKMVKHAQEKENAVNECRFSLMYKVNRRWPKDGLTTLDYKVLNVTFEKLFTRILVDLKEEESRAKLAKEKICAKR